MTPDKSVCMTPVEPATTAPEELQFTIAGRVDRWEPHERQLTIGGASCGWLPPSGSWV